MDVVLETDFGRVLCEFKVSDTALLTDPSSDGDAVEPVIEYKAGQPL